MADLIVHSGNPFNAETPLDRLRADLTTQQRDFYVRLHGDVPVLTAAPHRLQVRSWVARPHRCPGRWGRRCCWRSR